MPVSDDLELIFVHIPKNAGTSIYKKYFDDGSGRGRFFGHHKWTKYINDIPDKWGEYTTFSVVRNPWDRVVSNYVYARKEESYWHNAINPDKSEMGKHFDYETLKDRTFSEAVDMLSELKHQGWGPQYPYICDEDLNIKVNYVLKMERLEEELGEMFSEIGLDLNPNTGKVNVTRKNKNYREWYNEETKEVVADYYDIDFDLFDYSF